MPQILKYTGVNSEGKEVRHLAHFSLIVRCKMSCAKGVKRKARCGNCSGCVTKDCGTCHFCQDMKKFGGSGRLKKACIQRKCQGDRNQQQPTGMHIYFILVIMNLTIHHRHKQARDQGKHMYKLITQVPIHDHLYRLLMAQNLAKSKSVMIAQNLTPHFIISWRSQEGSCTELYLMVTVSSGVSPTKYVAHRRIIHLSDC